MSAVRFIVATVFVVLLAIPLFIVAVLLWTWCKIPDFPDLDGNRN